MLQTELTRKAYRIAKKAHEGQTDKAGKPYIGHPVRVAETVGDDEYAVCAALLHDTVEDTNVTLDDLKGFPKEVTDAVALLTHDKSVPYMDYVKKVATNKIAKKVKLADLKDNMNLRRLPYITREDMERYMNKYVPARRYLNEISQNNDETNK